MRVLKMQMRVMKMQMRVMKMQMRVLKNADESNENAHESTENADESTDTLIFETSDFNTNTDLVSSAESEPSGNTQNTQTLSQYVRGPDTQDNSQEMYPDTLSQSSEPLIRSARRREQIY